MPVTATVRMYNQKNLGDCFLINFSNGKKEAWMLIDFGSYETNKAREIEIGKHIKDTLKTAPVNVVLTHQHKDHLSGFISAWEHIGKLNMNEFWLSFLDNEFSEEGKALKEVSTKYWNKSAKIHTAVKKKIEENKIKGNTAARVSKMLEAKEGLDTFAEGQSGGEAIKLLSGRAKQTRFFTPGDHFDLPGMEGEVKVYVLGPPTDFNYLKSMNPKGNEAVLGLAALGDINLQSAFMLEAVENYGSDFSIQGFPFSGQYISKENAEARKLYENAKNDWRSIDGEWLADVGKMALQMDTLTNNTSLVLAFELVKTKKVLLFVGDAQIGNWKSWFNVEFKDSDVTAEDLLKRTVLYKAGHHSSHNATYSKGLELMNEKELVIMVPLNQEVSDRKGFLMGKPGMIRGYNRKSQGRMVRTDTIFQKGGKAKSYQFPFVSTVTGKTGLKGLTLNPINANPPGKPHMYIEYVVQ